MPDEVYESYRVVKIPKGGAPLAVRQEWVGLLLPGRAPDPIEQEFGFEVEIETDAVVPKRHIVLVSIEAALEILKGKSPEAAQWFRDHGITEGTFAFGADELLKE